MLKYSEYKEKFISELDKLKSMLNEGFIVLDNVNIEHGFDEIKDDDFQVNHCLNNKHTLIVNWHDVTEKEL